MRNSKKVLITGATGLIGTRLTEILQQKGYEVSHLGRRRKKHGPASFVWDVDKHYVEPGALSGIDAIIHLAGENVSEKSWTEERKEEILLSRTRSGRLLHDELMRSNNSVRTLISASGIGYYGIEAGDNELLKEDTVPGSDFLAIVTRKWEAEADKISELVRVCKVRTGIVLSKKGGALPKLAKPVKLFVGAPLGTGKQYMNWIHIDDLCAVYIYLLENESLSGAFNASAPNPVTNKVFTKAVAKALKKPLWLPRIPSFLLKIVLGEMAYIVLKGGKVSPGKIQQTGFQFQYPELQPALNSLLK